MDRRKCSVALTFSQLIVYEIKHTGESILVDTSFSCLFN